MGWLWEGLRRMFCSRPKQAPGDASKLHCSEREVQDAVTSSIEKSKVHWSELPVQPTTSETLAELEIQEKNRTSWEALQQLNSSFFQDWSKKIEIGQLIAEGGQAQIYEATWKMNAQTSDLRRLGVSMERVRKFQAGWRQDDQPTEILDMAPDMVVKVFNCKLKGCSLEDFSTQWPRVSKISDTVLKHQQGRLFASLYRQYYICPIAGAYVLEDNRFAFLMQRYKCDLRSLIDSRIRENSGHGPPFPDRQKCVLWCIAKGMSHLHLYGVLHRDLKASNVLVGDESGKFTEYVVSDFECSLSTIGTGFWRAPEVLQELRDRNGRKLKDLWTTQSDVYSYGMLCYEVLTGGIPFVEFRSTKDWDEIIDHDRRPVFPDYVDPELQEMVKRCWDRDPEKGPSFDDIAQELKPRYLGQRFSEETLF